MSFPSIDVPRTPSPVIPQGLVPQDTRANATSTVTTLTPAEVAALAKATSELTGLFAPPGGLAGQLEPPDPEVVRATLQEHQALYGKLSGMEVLTQDAAEFCVMYEAFAAAIAKADKAAADGQEVQDFAAEVGRAMFESIVLDDSMEARQNRLAAALASKPELGAQALALSQEDMMALILSCLKMVLDSNRELQKTFMDMGIQEAHLQMKMLENAASHTRDAAKTQMIATMVQGASQIAGGAMQAKSAVNSFTNSMAAHKAGQEANRLESKLENMPEVQPGDRAGAMGRQRMELQMRDYQDKSSLLGATATKQHAFGQAWGSALSGLGTMFSAPFTYKAQSQSADADLARKAATGYEIVRQSHTAIAGEGTRGVNSAIDLKLSLLNSLMQTEKALSNKNA